MDFEYTVVSGGVIITDCNLDTSSVTIPAKIDGKLVVEIASNAFKNKKGITSIKIESNSKACIINSNSFCNLTSLKSFYCDREIEGANLPNIFKGCNKLQTVNLSGSKYNSVDGVVFIGSKLVYYPAGISKTSYTIPDFVDEISNDAFKGNTKIKKLRFSNNENFKCDWKNLFKSLENLESIVVYSGTPADTSGIQYFDGEIIYYD